MTDTELQMMDGSNTTQSYVLVGETGTYQLGIKPKLAAAQGKTFASLMVRLAIKPELELDSTPDWNEVVPQLTWAVQDANRARTSIYRQIENLAPHQETTLQQLWDQHGDFLFAGLLDHLYSALPRTFKAGGNSKNAVYYYCQAKTENILPKAPVFGAIQMDQPEAVEATEATEAPSDDEPSD